MTPVTMEEKPGTVIALKEDKAVEQALRKQIESFQVIPVTDAASFESAGENKKGMVAVQKAWKGYWEPLRVAARSVVDMILEKRDTLDTIIEKKKEEQTATAKKWADEEERKRLEAERKAQEASRKQAEDEALALAVELEKNGDKEEAEAIIKAPVPVAQVIVPKTVPKGYGGMTQKYYSATVTDIKALAKAVLDGKVPAMAIMGNETFLNAQARQLKETMAYPGVQVNVR